MFRFLSTAATLAVLLTPGLSAQIAGSYSLSGTPAAEMTITLIPLTNLYWGVITLNGQVIEGESMIITPDADDPNHFTTENQRGNRGEMDRDDAGDLDDKITSGPNKGKTTHWEKQ